MLDPITSGAVETPDPFTSDVDTDGMVTLYMSMALNPVMGGSVIHVEADRVLDADLAVEEGIRSIVIGGVAVSGDSADETVDNGIESSEKRSAR